MLDPGSTTKAIPQLATASDARATVRREVKSSLYVATPAYGGLVTTQYTTSMLRLCKVLPDTTWDLLSGSLVPQSRNILVAQFLCSQATHLFFVDADIGFATDQVLEMLRFDQSFVAGVYPLKVYPLSVFGKPTTPCEQIGRFITGEFCGAGFMLLNREVIERMIDAYPETRYIGQYSVGDTACPKYHALFDCIIHDGMHLSEDYTFCRRWRSIGGKIWLDMKGKLTHTGAHTFCAG